MVATLPREDAKHQPNATRTPQAMACLGFQHEITHGEVSEHSKRGEKLKKKRGFETERGAAAAGGAVLMPISVSSDHLPRPASLPGSPGTECLLRLEFVIAC